MFKKFLFGIIPLPMFACGPTFSGVPWLMIEFIMLISLVWTAILGLSLIWRLMQKLYRYTDKNPKNNENFIWISLSSLSLFIAIIVIVLR